MTAIERTPHDPVMLPQVLEALSPRDGAVYVDGTFGAGGYTRAILEAADCTVIALDRDPSVDVYVQSLREAYGKRFVFVHGCFGDVETLLRQNGYDRVDGFVLDLGVSSMQIDQAQRGFSFRFTGPLDMRMDTSADISTAADLVNRMREEDLANLIYKYGEERKSRKIASKIVRLRAEKPFETTLDLADAVRSVVPRSPKDKSDPATRTFQALRIAVNDEMGELERALAASENILAPGGRLVVVTFHSLEDSLVKAFIREKSGRIPGGSRHLPPGQKQTAEPAFIALYNKAQIPSDAEQYRNSRSRSAKLRAAIREPAPQQEKSK